LRAWRQRDGTLALLETDEPTNDSDRLAANSRVGNAKPVVPAASASVRRPRVGIATFAPAMGAPCSLVIRPVMTVWAWA